MTYAVLPGEGSVIGVIFSRARLALFFYRYDKTCHKTLYLLVVSTDNTK